MTTELTSHASRNEYAKATRLKLAVALDAIEKVIRDERPAPRERLASIEAILDGLEVRT